MTETSHHARGQRPEAQEPGGHGSHGGRGQAPGAAARRRALRGFVGRDRELAELTAGLDDALSGLGRLFLLAGEPGIGKTGLTEQVAAYATDRGAATAWGRCWEGGGAPPFWPWAQIVEAVAAGCDDQTLLAWLGPGAAVVAGMAPGIGFRLGASAAAPGGSAVGLVGGLAGWQAGGLAGSPAGAAPAGPFGVALAAPAASSDAARFFLFQAVAAFLKRAALAQPLALIFEDLHAADDASLLLLRYLARDLRGARLFLLGTFRDAEVARLPALSDAVGELVREGHLTTVRGLTRDEVRDLIGQLAGVAPSPGAVAAIYEATEGNPLFVREAVRLLASSGAIDTPGRPTVPIPGSVRTLIQQRLAPLSVNAVQTLSAAAVVGREFDLTLVGPACELPLTGVMTAVSEAVAFGIVSEEAVSLGRYRFSHSLMREVIYESLPIPVRTSLHLAVGEAIERLYGADADSHVAELARHFAELASAGESARALTYTRRAGDRAMRTHAYDEAVAEYERALRAFDIAGAANHGVADQDATGQGATGQGAPPATIPDDTLRCELLLSLGAAQVRAGRSVAAKETHLQAVELARRLGQAELFAQAALGYGEPYVEGGLVNRRLVGLLRDALERLSQDDSALRARLLARLSVELTFSDEVHLTDGLSQQAVTMARRVRNVPALGAALDARWMAVWGPDGLAERTALAGEALQLAADTGNPDLELVGRGQRATSALESGDLLAWEADIAGYARLADELRLPIGQWTVTSMRATRALLLGQFAEAGQLAEAALALQPELPNSRWAYVNETAMLAWEQARLGDLQATWQSIVERFPRAGFARGWLALADLARGDVDAARRGLQILAEQLPNRPRSGLWLSGAALGAFAAAELDDQDAASRLYAVLRPYAGHIAVMPIEHPVICFGSTSLHLGQLATVSGDWDAAIVHLDAALREHERLGAAPWLARTRYEYARMLRRRGRPADQSQADALLGLATATAEALGMAGLQAQIARLPAAVRAPGATSQPYASAAPAPPDIASQTAPVASETTAPLPAPERTPSSTDASPTDASLSADERFQREGEFWTVAYNGTVVRLKDSKGLRQIALLLAQPGRELPVTELEALVSGPGETDRATAGADGQRGDLDVRADTGDAGELLDVEAKAAYRARLTDLQEEIDEAEAFNDSERAEAARTEREFLIRELSRAVGLGGRDRKAASHAERARLNATRAIRSAMANLTREHPMLGQHLAATIKTGRYCSYTPDPRTPVVWRL